ncbi:MAG: exodeoxyribonuclease VII large subunit [Oscillospiraceae bacterium]|nr:exodeoxyribonuclease VII large subunit [Oscillospiraceae bacterium]
MDLKAFTVTSLNNYIKNLFDKDEVLISVFVKGEISNYKYHSSGHHYFSLKDTESSVRCVLFRNNANNLKFKPENGMKVLIFGRVSVYLRDGTYQIYCQKIIPEGAGELQLAFEQLKKKLNEEGLFDQAHKKSIPEYPERIAVITSPTGAAVRDILNILNKRWPLSSVLVVPVIVQGSDAPADIAEAVSYVNRYELADLIITGRGGGSIEDLWAFNTELVCRAIFDSVIPVISAVGHEPDVTLSDFVSDLRASTPSNAAEYAVPDIKEIRDKLDGYRIRIEHRLDRLVSDYRSRLDGLKKNRLISDSSLLFNDNRLDLAAFYDDFERYIDNYLNTEKSRLNAARGRLSALNPYGVLSRGYTVAIKEGKTVFSAKQLSVMDSIELIFNDGSAECTVKRITSREKNIYE